MDEESRMKGNPPHESDEDESDDEEDYCEVFFFTNCHDVPDEKTEFGNDYFTRNGIPVPDLPAAKHPKCPTDVPKNDAKEFQQYKTQTWEETGSENQEMGELELEEQDMSENRDSDNEDSHEEDFDYVNYVENHDRDRELSFPPEIDMDESKNEERLESPFKFLDEHSFSKGCEYCGKRFTSKSGYMVHTSCYTRRLAAKLAKKQKNVTGHISQDQDQLFECLECDKKFKGKDCLAMHAYCHFEPRFVCKVCPYKTGYIATAKRHELKHARKMATGVSLLNGPPVLKIKSSPSVSKIIRPTNPNKVTNVSGYKFQFIEELPFNKVCERCGRNFMSKPPFMTHSSCYKQRLEAKRTKEGNEVTNISLFECLECDKGFKTMEGLRQHASCHYGPRFKCRKCSYSNNFSHEAKSHDQKHIQGTRIRKSKRKTLDSSDATEVKVTRVEKTDCKTESIPSTSTSSGTDRESEQQCEYCKETFQSKAQFMTHPDCYNVKLVRQGRKRRKGHSDPWYCLDCDFVTPNRSVLVKHIDSQH